MAAKIVVIGGGIAGLAASFELLQRRRSVSGGLQLTCLEAATSPGGNIRTFHEDGFTCEWGPNGFLDNVPATLKLVERLGLSDRLLPADRQSAIRYIYRKGKLRKVPDGPLSFLRSDIITMSGKLRVFREPFAARRPENHEETVTEFASRRIGAEAARILVGAMVTGIYAGDASRLCLRSTFPKMYDMETEHGSLVRAMIANAKEGSRAGPSGPGGHLHSFKTGLQELICALASELGSSLVLNCPVKALDKQEDGRYRVITGSDDGIDADAVILSAPAWKAAPLLAGIDAELAGAVAGIHSAPLAVVHLGYDDFPEQHRPHGFGFLVPRGEGLRILGVLWASNIFPGRADDKKLLMTAMAGGTHDPAILEMDDDRLVQAVLRDVETAMGHGAAPGFIKVFRHRRGIPQYTIGHQARLRKIDDRLKSHPGLLVHGNSYRGISVNLCVDQAPEVAEKVLSFISKN